MHSIPSRPSSPWLAIIGLVLAACTSSGTPTDVTNRIYVVGATSGSVTAGATPGSLTVTLEAVDPALDWYTDRPARSAGEEPPAAFFGTTWSQVYGAVPPNALLQFRNATGVHGLVGAVSGPRYDAGTRRLTVSMAISLATADLGAGPAALDVPVLTIQNNLVPPAEGSSFALHTGTARMQPGGGGGYQLVVGDVDPEVIWMNGAPARSADFEGVGAFVDYWDERFGASLPNGSLAGDMGDGTFRVVPLTLSLPTYDSATRTLTFSATLLPGVVAPAPAAILRDAVLFVDAGPRATPSTVFSRTWRGVAYSAIPSRLKTRDLVKASEAWDSDMTSDNFQSQWGTRDGCGRKDLATLADAGANLVRLYDYNYSRSLAPAPGVAGNGHVAFLKEADRLGIKVIVPVSNFNFQDGQYAWDSIENTVSRIVESVKENGSILPAVHSFSVGNELDLHQDGAPIDRQITRAIEVVRLLHKYAPDHYVTIPISNAYETRFYDLFKSGARIDAEGNVVTTGGTLVGPIPADVYASRFYNSVQTFKLGGAPGAPDNDLERNILLAYDARNYGVPLVITELGRSNLVSGSTAAKVDQVAGQAQAARGYLDAHPGSQFKGFAIFEWQDSRWKRNPATPDEDNTESTFGIQSYAGSLCSASTGRYILENGQVHDPTSYAVDALAPLNSPAHPEGLLKALSAWFR